MQEWIRQSEGCNDECSDQRGNAYRDKAQEKPAHLFRRSQFSAVEPA
jgi:hypothetical protein